MSGKRYFIEDDTKIKKIAYISGIVLLVSAIVLIFVLSLYQDKVQADTKVAAQKMNDIDIEVVESTTSSEDRTINEVKEENLVVNDIKEEVKETTKTEKKKAPEKKVEKKKELKFSVPVKGEILRDYADTTLIYSDTLEEWTTHYGVDILAQKGSAVSASESGTVKSIKDDPRYGLTITIEHEDGFETVYSSLLSSEFVSEGEKVEKGQTIGTVGNSATFEIADDYHLHFEMILNGNNVNPVNYWK